MWSVARPRPVGPIPSLASSILVVNTLDLRFFLSSSFPYSQPAKPGLKDGIYNVGGLPPPYRQEVRPLFLLLAHFFFMIDNSHIRPSVCVTAAALSLSVALKRIYSTIVRVQTVYGMRTRMYVCPTESLFVYVHHSLFFFPFRSSLRPETGSRPARLQQILHGREGRD